MATYKITSPDGTVYRVSGDGTEQEALAALQAQLTAPPTRQAPSPAVAAPTEQALGPSGPGVTKDVVASLGALAEGAKQGTGNVLRGVAELGLTDAEQQAVKTQGGFQNFPAPDYAATKAAHPYATSFGEAAPYIAAGTAASMVPGAQGFLPAIATQAAAAGLVGAAQPGTLAERASRAGADAALGGLGGAVGGALGAAAQRAMRPVVMMMREAGVVPTVGQTLGGIPSRIEEAAGSLPIVGHMIDAARQRARNEFNVGAINQALERTGGRVAEAGTEGIAKAQQVVTSAYDAARAAAPGGLPLDSAARGELTNLRRMLGDAPVEVERDVLRFMDNNLKRRLGPARGFEPKTFKELDADIGDRIRGAAHPLEKDAFAEMQRVLRDSAGRANPAYMEAQRVADTAAARLMRIENATNRAVNQGGVFTPGQLNMAARAMDTSSRKRATAGGHALSQPYATAGQQVLGDVVPNSGTPVRMMVSGGALGAGYAIDPTILAAMAALAAGSTRPAQQAMNAALRGGRYAPAWLGQLLQGANGE